MVSIERRKDYPKIIEYIQKNGSDLITVKEYFETKLTAIECARKYLYDAMEKRLEGMNEFRDTLKDQASKFVTRDELKLMIERMENDIRMLRESKAMLEGKASQLSVNIALLFAIIGVIMGIFQIIK